MGGYVTWIGVGISAFVTGYEAIIAQNPELAAAFGLAGVLALGFGRKLEKAMAAYRD